MKVNKWTQKDIDKLGDKVKGTVTKSSRTKTSKLKGERCAKPYQGWVIEIKGEVPSSKNSRILTIINGKPKSFPSKATQSYIKNTLEEYESNREKFQAILSQRKPPYQVYVKILRYRNDVWDYQNAVQIIADMMQKAKWIEDDDRNTLQLFHVPYTLVSSPEEAGIVLIF